ncbi:MAG TPA: glycosyltransferase [Myxococcales bacterium]|nr:glycosyltransferase [Myxococcales bacterium]
MAVPAVQVIVTTYEQPRYLELVLLALERQSAREFGLVVADDGSGHETREVVERARKRRPVLHLWQRNRGFRKCRALNRAVAAATAEYLVFLDGDSLPRRDWLARHLAAAAPGRYLAGRLVRFDRDLSGRVVAADVESGRFARRGFLWREWRAGHLAQKPQYAFVPAALGAALFRRDGGSWTGANCSAWRADVLAVNGFDERLGYGFEDTDFGWRLGLHGVRRRSVRYAALAFHLDHDRSWRDEAAMAKHRALAEESLRLGAWRCYHGIDRLAAGAELEDRAA